MQMKLTQKLLYLCVGTALMGPVHSMDKESSNPLYTMPISKQIAQAKEWGISLEDYRRLMNEQFSPKEESFQSKKDPVEPHKKGNLPKIIRNPVDSLKNVEPPKPTTVTKYEDSSRRVHVDGVLAGLWDLSERSHDNWSDKALEEGREKFKELSLMELNKTIVRDFVSSKSEAIANMHREAIEEKKIALALNQIKKYQEQHLDLKIGDDLFFMLGKEGVSKDSVLQRVNSSGQNNNCLLFSIIRENKDLLTRVVGDEEVAEQILSVPENANVSPEDGPRRDFDLVREFFFEKIRQNLDKSFPTVDGDRMTIRDYLHHVIEDTNRLYGIKITEGVEQLLATLAYNNLMLDIDFSVVFSLLYQVPVYVMSPSTENKLQMIQYTPDLFVMPKGDPIYVYHSGRGGCHYQKLFVVRERNNK
jgi:hypothetical protein